MKKFQIKLTKKQGSSDLKGVDTIKLDGQTNPKAKRADVIAWAKREYPDYEVTELRLFKDGE